MLLSLSAEREPVMLVNPWLVLTLQIVTIQTGSDVCVLYLQHYDTACMSAFN